MGKRVTDICTLNNHIIYSVFIIPHSSKTTKLVRSITYSLYVYSQFPWWKTAEKGKWWNILTLGSGTFGVQSSSMCGAESVHDVRASHGMVTCCYTKRKHMSVAISSAAARISWTSVVIMIWREIVNSFHLWTVTFILNWFQKIRYTSMVSDQVAF